MLGGLPLCEMNLRRFARDGPRQPKTRCLVGQRKITMSLNEMAPRLGSFIL